MTQKEDVMDEMGEKLVEAIHAISEACGIIGNAQTIHELSGYALEPYDGVVMAMSPSYAVQIMVELAQIIKTMPNECKMQVFDEVNDAVNGMHTLTIEDQSKWLKYMQTMSQIIDLMCNIH